MSTKEKEKGKALYRYNYKSYIDHGSPVMFRIKGKDTFLYRYNCKSYIDRGSPVESRRKHFYLHTNSKLYLYTTLSFPFCFE